MIAYEIQLRYVIRDKIQSEKKIEKKSFCQKKKLPQILSQTDSNQSELSQDKSMLIITKR